MISSDCEKESDVCVTVVCEIIFCGESPEGALTSAEQCETKQRKLSMWQNNDFKHTQQWNLN